VASKLPSFTVSQAIVWTVAGAVITGDGVNVVGPQVVSLGKVVLKQNVYPRAGL